MMPTGCLVLCRSKFSAFLPHRRADAPLASRSIATQEPVYQPQHAEGVATFAIPAGWQRIATNLLKLDFT